MPSFLSRRTKADWLTPSFSEHTFAVNSWMTYKSRSLFSSMGTGLISYYTLNLWFCSNNRRQKTDFYGEFSSYKKRGKVLPSPLISIKRHKSFVYNSLKRSKQNSASIECRKTVFLPPVKSRLLTPVKHIILKDCQFTLDRHHK